MRERENARAREREQRARERESESQRKRRPVVDKSEDLDSIASAKHPERPELTQLRDQYHRHLHNTYNRQKIETKIRRRREKERKKDRKREELKALLCSGKYVIISSISGAASDLIIHPLLFFWFSLYRSIPRRLVLRSPSFSGCLSYGLDALDAEPSHPDREPSECDRRRLYFSFELVLCVCTLSTITGASAASHNSFFIVVKHPKHSTYTSCRPADSGLALTSSQVLCHPRLH